MLKHISFVFLFFILRGLFAQTLTATQNIPENVTIGSSFIITTTINRGQINDFIEFCQPLPKGFTATEIDSKGGDFVFDKNEVKIIWRTPPPEDIYTFSFLITVPKDVSDSQKGGDGKVIYITSNNELKVFLFQIKKIKLISPKTLKKKTKSVPLEPTDSTQILVKADEAKKEEKQADDKLKERESFDKYLNSAVVVVSDNASLTQLKTKLDSGRAEINRLKAELEKINSSNLVSSTGGIVSISETNRFTNDNGKPATSGFYVVIGTFGNKGNADRFRATNVMKKGHLNAKIIQNQFTKVYNIYVLKTNNKSDAEAERIKYKPEYPDVWILKLE